MFHIPRLHIHKTTICERSFSNTHAPQLKYYDLSVRERKEASLIKCVPPILRHLHWSNFNSILLILLYHSFNSDSFSQIYGYMFISVVHCLVLPTLNKGLTTENNKFL